MMHPVRKPPNDSHDENMHGAEVTYEEEAPRLVRDERGESIEDDAVSHGQLRD
jgi:hypothetical protein